MNSLTKEYYTLDNLNKNPQCDKSSVLNGSVEPRNRSSGPNSAMPPPPINGGIFVPPQAPAKPWLPIPVTPTTTNYIHYNLRSANPPPGAIDQYPGTNRPGNNFISMPGVFNYHNTNKINTGPFDIKVTHKNKVVNQPLPFEPEINY